MACNHGKHLWTEGNIAWLRANAVGLSVAEIARRFNRRFRAGVSVGAVRQRMYKNNIRNGVDARFKPGQVVPNGIGKGEYYAGSERGWFKKRGKPHNTALIGTVVKDTLGYLKIKVGEPKEWVQLHHALWEHFHGPVPEGHKVLFGDGDRMNLSPKNLVCVSSAQLAVMNRQKFIYSDAGLTKTGALMASVKSVAYRRKLNLNLNKKKERKKNGAKRV